MSNDFLIYTLPLIAETIVGGVITGYAAYLALSVWRGMAVPIYRSRALWTAVLPILFALTFFVGTVFANLPPPYLFLASIYFQYVYAPLELVLFVWIDRTINTLIRLDFLRRDLLGWRWFRFIYWPLAAVAVVSSTLPTAPGSSLAIIIGSLPLVVPFGYAALALFIGSRKTADITFKSHAKWGGWLMVGVLVSGLAYAATPVVWVQDLPYILIAYSFYKMAKFLVPTSAMPSVEP